MEEWRQTIRPTIPGPMLILQGTVKDRPGEIVFLALNQDEATYRANASDPDQDAWYRRLRDVLEDDVRWEDVELEIALQD